MIDILDLVLNGRLGDVEIGVSERFVRSALGDPLHFEPARKSYPTFFLYGPLELRFRTGSLVYIGLVLGDHPNLEDIQLTDTQGIVERRLAAFEEFLLANGQRYNVDQVMTDDSQTVIITSKNVHLAFDEDGRLSKIAAEVMPTNDWAKVPRK